MTADGRGELDALARIYAAGTAAGVTLWWVALVDRATTPSEVLAVSMHEDPRTRVPILLDSMRQRAPDTWRLIVCPVTLDALTPEELGIVVTLPRDVPIRADGDDGGRAYQLTSAEYAVVARVVVADLARPRPWRAVQGREAPARRAPRPTEDASMEHDVIRDAVCGLCGKSAEPDPIRIRFTEEALAFFRKKFGQDPPPSVICQACATAPPAATISLGLRAMRDVAEEIAADHGATRAERRRFGAEMVRRYLAGEIPGVPPPGHPVIERPLSR
jgi:hypothetical protein